MQFVLNDSPEWETLYRSLGVLPSIAKVLVRRGISSPVSAERFISSQVKDVSNPFLLPDIEPALSRIKMASIDKEKICLYGDYDVDGLTSVAVVLHTMKGLGFDVSYYIPNRLSEGYGLNINAIDRIKEGGSSLIITLDCGVSSVSAIDYAKSSGIDVIVVDHHNPPATLPPAIAIVDPKKEDSIYPFKDLSGVGVAWQFARAIINSLLEEDTYLEETLDIVALGTIADVVPLLDENRAIVRRGLSRLKFSPRVGLSALMKRAGIEGRMMNAELLAMTLIPRLNSAGRLGSAELAMDLLLTVDPVNARLISERLEENNQKRRGLVDEVLDEVLKRLEDKVLASTILEYSETWHSGVLGIVASRLVDMFNRPVFIGKKENDTVKFSVRSPEEIDIYSILAGLKDTFLKFGGHRYALGFTIRESEIGRLLDLLEESIKIGDHEELVEIDAELPLSDITPIFINQLMLLEPFGVGNPRPVFIARGVNVIGKEMQNNSKRIIIEENGNIFEVSASDDTIPTDSPIDLVYSIKGMGKIIGIGGLKSGSR
ncbi:MAG: single-stranded-DNA-specific exonuclease RecJ [Dictyoglomi bacterium]|nr:single-stranded-DNA-specific exonuclease RecJ [Dictyoglomota bacterium]